MAILNDITPRLGWFVLMQANNYLKMSDNDALALNSMSDATITFRWWTNDGNNILPISSVSGGAYALAAHALNTSDVINHPTISQSKVDGIALAGKSRNDLFEIIHIQPNTNYGFHDCEIRGDFRTWNGIYLNNFGASSWNGRQVFQDIKIDPLSDGNVVYHWDGSGKAIGQHDDMILTSNNPETGWQMPPYSHAYSFRKLNDNVASPFMVHKPRTDVYPWEDGDYFDVPFGTDGMYDIEALLEWASDPVRDWNTETYIHTFYDQTTSYYNINIKRLLSGGWSSAAAITLLDVNNSPVGNHNHLNRVLGAVTGSFTGNYPNTNWMTGIYRDSANNRWPNTTDYNHTIFSLSSGEGNYGGVNSRVNYLPYHIGESSNEEDQSRIVYYDYADGFTQAVNYSDYVSNLSSHDVRSLTFITNDDPNKANHFAMSFKEESDTVWHSNDGWISIFRNENITGNGTRVMDTWHSEWLTRNLDIQANAYAQNISGTQLPTDLVNINPTNAFEFIEVRPIANLNTFLPPNLDEQPVTPEVIGIFDLGIKSDDPVFTEICEDIQSFWLRLWPLGSVYSDSEADQVVMPEVVFIMNDTEYSPGVQESAKIQALSVVEGSPFVSIVSELVLLNSTIENQEVKYSLVEINLSFTSEIE